MELDRVTLVLLKRPANARDYPEEELDRIQGEHLDFMSQQREKGTLLINGPFEEQPDETWRGLCIYGTGIEEARSIAEQDPAVKAERLEVEAFTWLYPRGLMSFSG